ncbi:Putative terminase-like family protein (plasmid) [Borrelia crocidurae DOU]|uniref:Putative terminase-like family protein n=1 Tax=Borrelia crocidurae DOU TaxID=1293575 RepID=W5SLV9_9SPIR|nr:hypothetical protein [Borrelia crocidurae]AHH07862.1 Putative terminase-like family protein [Borrelia crocidurae DOU]
MDIYSSSIFKSMQREYKREFGIDIASLIKPKPVVFDFKSFENKLFTKKQPKFIMMLLMHYQQHI